MASSDRRQHDTPHESHERFLAKIKGALIRLAGRTSRAGPEDRASWELHEKRVLNSWLRSSDSRPSIISSPTSFSSTRTWRASTCESSRRRAMPWSVLCNPETSTRFSKMLLERKSARKRRCLRIWRNTLISSRNDSSKKLISWCGTWLSIKGRLGGRMRGVSWFFYWA